MNLSHFQQAIWHGRGSDAGPGEAGDHGREIVAPVEAVFEPGEVARHVPGADGPAGSGNGGLDVAESGVGRDTTSQIASADQMTALDLK